MSSVWLPPAVTSFLWLLACLNYLDSSPVLHQQTVCNLETFNASCPVGHVIIMASAQYGRMQLGRCLASNLSVGCMADVLNQADLECSGKQNCLVPIPNTKFGAVQTCRKDLVVHFEASYRCVPASSPSRHFCPRGKRALNFSDGYIVFYPALARTSCTLAVKVKEGQTIKVTVLDFTRLRGRERQTKPCSLQVGFEERGGSTSYIDACKTLDHQRESLLFLSQDSQLNITILPRQNTAESVLIHYQATGCANLAAPALGHVERVKDTLVITCNKSGEKWHLVCKDESWVGNFDNCTAGGSYLQEDDFNQEETLPLGLLVAIALGVLLGVFAGFLFLLLAFLCRQSLHRRPDINSTTISESRGYHGNTYKMVDVQGPGTATGMEESCYMCYHDYEGTPSVYMRAGLDVPGATDKEQTNTEVDEGSKEATVDCGCATGCPNGVGQVPSVLYRGQTPQRQRWGGEGVGETGDQQQSMYRFGGQPVRVPLPSVSVNAELKYS